MQSIEHESYYQVGFKNMLNKLKYNTKKDLLYDRIIQLRKEINKVKGREKVGVPIVERLEKQLHLLTEEWKYVSQNTGTEHLYMDESYTINYASYLFFEGKYLQAISVLENGLNLYHGKSDLIRIEKCRQLILMEKHFQAETALEGLMNPDAPCALFERAKLCLLREENTMARHYFDAILEQVKDRIDVILQFTFFLATHHKMKDAGDCWERIYKKPQHSYDFMLTRVVMEYACGNYQNALTHCKKLSKEYNTILANLYLISLACLLHKRTLALRSAEQLSSIHPNCLYAKTMLQGLDIN